MGETARSRALYETVQHACAGYTVEEVLQALTDSVCSALGFGVNTLDEADRFIDALPEDLKRTVRVNWTHLRAMRAQHRGAGHA